MLDEIVNEEFNRFLREINETEYEIGCYLDETNYEDEYSHNDIDRMQAALERSPCTLGRPERSEEEMIRTYLCVHHPGKFVLSASWCVHVMTPEHARKAHVSEHTIENCLVR